MEFHLENIKCGGCANSIRKQLEALEEIQAATVDIEGGRVSMELASGVEATEAVREKLAQLFLNMGYPESGSVEGFKAAGAKAKSFVSCAVGKMRD